MDPNPNSFPVLSYVMSRLNLNSNSQPQDPVDLEQAQLQIHRNPQQELLEVMPHLDHADLLASMAPAVSDVAKARSALRALGDRPDHESVDRARAAISSIDERLSNIEGNARAAAEGERARHAAVLQLDEMHEAYGAMLREAEERLVRIYERHGKEEEEGSGKGKEVAAEEANDEVIGILREEATGKGTERVELSGRQLRFLPEAFGRMRGLVSLNLSNNLLEVIPDAIAGLEHLQELRLSSNLLVVLPDSIGVLLNLKFLDVSGNKLKALPDSISKCRSLVELDASYNELAYLPTNIGHELVNLQKLLVHLNKLRSLPTSVCEMRSLRILDVHFNELRGLPYAIGKLSNLESLNLSSNFSDLKELPPTFGDLMNLRELDLSNNQIHALPDTFYRLDNLTKLNLEQNPLTVPPMEIVNQGVEAVKEYMAKRWLDILIAEESKNQLEEELPANAGWLTRSTSWLKNNLVYGVSGIMGSGDKSPRDAYLDQQL